MRNPGSSKVLRSSIIVIAASLLVVWTILDFQRMVLSQNGVIRITLTTLFALLILLRPSRPAIPAPDDSRRGNAAFLLAAGLAGTGLSIAGIVLNVHILNWVGLLALLIAGLKLVLPAERARNLPAAFFILYWAHPLPTPVFTVLEEWMQRMSVQGAEWLLHFVNVRVWADGMVLHSPFAVYEVPAWCSGMRAATTLFILAAGLGILMRLKWYETAAAAAVALAQALLLNIIRISAMVVMTSNTATRSGTEFLHDSAGVITLSGILLVFAEIMGWKRYKRNRAAARVISADEIPHYHPAWSTLARHKFIILFIISVSVLLPFAAFRNTPGHRAEMIKPVVAGLRDRGNLDAAQKAADQVSLLLPAGTEWELEVVRLLVLRARYRQALDRISRYPDYTGETLIQKRILQAYSLMGLNRISEAGGMVATLPRQVRENDPRVAMVLAELARFANDPGGVAEHVVQASKWRPNLPRIRALYSYLRAFRKWKAISDSDNLLIPHNDIVQALCASEAYMNLNDTAALTRIILRMADKWPDDPRILEPVFFLAAKHTTPEWEARFAATLTVCLKTVTEPDTLYPLMDKCFRLSRPDLARAVFARIKEIDPAHPALAMSVVRYGSSWFVFRKHQLGIKAATTADLVDIRGDYSVIPASDPFWTATPFPEMLLRKDVAEAQQILLKSALLEFRRRAQSGSLSVEMKYEYIYALNLAGETAEAAAQLRRLGAEDRTQQGRALIVLAETFERSGDWQNVYETLRTYPELPDKNLRALIRLANAQMHLGMGIAARYTAGDAFGNYPQTPLALTALAGILASQNLREEALYVLTRPLLRRDPTVDLMQISMLEATERYTDARAVCRAAVLPPLPPPPSPDQKFLLPPAELSLFWHKLALPSERQFADNAALLSRNLETSTSPFFKAMIPAWLEFYKDSVTRKTPVVDLQAEIERWQNTGRDRIEKATALHELALLLCLREQYPDARLAAARATALFPESPQLWHELISLSSGDPQVISEARKHCPDDGDIWLAELVTGTRRLGWKEPDALRLLDSGRMTPAAMTRAGDFLLRIGMKNAAAAAASNAVREAHGLLPAHVLGIKTALALRDRDKMIGYTQGAIATSYKPIPEFYLKMVELKISQGSSATDSDSISALKYMRLSDPSNPLWAQMLGYLRFSRSGWDMVDALSQMSDAINSGATNAMPYIIGAESARQLGNMDRAADLLKKGLATNPGNQVMLNNLVYTLALTPGREKEALELAPGLTKLAGQSPNVMDTVAVAQLKGGDPENAWLTLSNALTRTALNSPDWFRIRQHQAEVLRARAAKGIAEKTVTGKASAETSLAAARSILKDILNYSSTMSDDDIMAASSLLDQVEEEYSRIEIQVPQ